MANREPKRILLIHDGEGRLRGSERVALDLVQGLMPHGVQWHVLTNHEAFATACRSEHIEVSEIPFRRLFLGQTTLRDFQLIARAAKELRSIFRSFRPDVVHINNGGACQWAVPWSWVYGIPTAVHIHAPWSRKMRFLLGLHLPEAIVGVSHAVVARFRTEPISARRLRVIYNAAPDADPVAKVDRKLAFRDIPLRGDEFILAFTGVLIAGKRPLDAIQAIAGLPNHLRNQVHLLIVGEGHLKTELMTAAKDLPVTFLGHRDDVLHVMKNGCDAVILPSEIEAFSLTLLEAAACGIGRIAADAGGNDESIIDGLDGLLYPVGDIQACTRAIATLAENRALCVTFGQRAQDRVKADFTPARFNAEFLELYRHLMNSRGRGRLHMFCRGAASMIRLALR